LATARTTIKHSVSIKQYTGFQAQIGNDRVLGGRDSNAPSMARRATRIPTTPTKTTEKSATRDAKAGTVAARDSAKKAATTTTAATSAYQCDRQSHSAWKMSCCSDVPGRSASIVGVHSCDHNSNMPLCPLAAVIAKKKSSYWYLEQHFCSLW